MARWDHTIDLSDLYERLEDGDMTQAEYMSGVIERLEESKLIDDCLLQQLRDARDVDDPDEWDEAFSDVYDHCDERRIWLKTLA